MNARLSIALCAVMIGVSSLSLCNPPIPRTTPNGAPANAAVSPTDTMVEDFLAAFDRVERAIQMHYLDGPLSLYSMRYN